MRLFDRRSAGIPLALWPGVKVRELVKRLEHDGWYEVAQVGSHRQFKHAAKAGRVTVAGHSGDDVPTGTLRRVFRQAGLEWQQRSS